MQAFSGAGEPIGAADVSAGGQRILTWRETGRTFEDQVGDDSPLPDWGRKRAIIADAGVQLVGIDYLSIEKFHSPQPRTHLALLSKGIPVIEGLSLKDVTPGDYDLIVLPLRVVGHEAAPARAILKRR